MLNINGQRGDAIFDHNFRIIMDVDQLGIYFDFILGIKIFIFQYTFLPRHERK